MASDAIVGLTHLSGWLAVFALIASLAMSLASRFLRDQRARLVAWRRVAGLVGFVSAVVHASIALTGVLSPPSVDEALTVIASVPYVRHGALALALLTPLAITSFPKINARVGLRTWETLHRGVYLAIALVLLHVLAGPSAEPHLAIAIAAIVLVLLLARLVPRSRVRETSDDEPRDQPPGLDATK